eukprot:100699_1
MFNALTIYTLCITSCCIFILVPIVLYYLKRLYDLRHNIIVAKRHWKPLSFQILCTALLLLIERPLTLLLTINFIDNNFYLHIGSKFLHIIVFHITLYLIFVRYWILHYDIGYSKAQTKFYWHELKTVSSTSSANFYRDYRPTLGNLSYLQRIISIPLAFSILTSCASYIVPYLLYKDPKLSDIMFFAIDSCILLIPFICGIIIIWVKTPIIYGIDMFGIKIEMKIISYLSVFGLILCILWTSIDSLIVTHTYEAWIAVINISISCALYFIINIYPLIYLFHISAQSYLLIANKIPSIINAESNTKWPLNVLLSSKTGMEAFMNHLIREYTHEHLLAIVEMMQFNNFYVDKTEMQIDELEKDYNQNYRPFQIKCSFISDIKSLKNFQNGIKNGNKELDDALCARAEKLEQHFLKNGLIKERQYHFRNYGKCFIGREAVPMIIKFILMNEKKIKRINTNEFSPLSIANKSHNETNALDFMNTLIKANIIKHVTKEHNFINGFFFYQFTVKYYKYKARAATNKMKSLISLAGNKAGSASKAKEQIKGLVLPQSIPQSSIVFNSRNCMKHKIVLLCNKYIVNDSPMEVNISGNCRDTLLRKKDKITHLSIDECKHIFDEVLQEIYLLINGAFPRFRSTNSYILMKEQMKLHKYFEDEKYSEPIVDTTSTPLIFYDHYNKQSPQKQMKKMLEIELNTTIHRHSITTENDESSEISINLHTPNTPMRTPNTPMRTPNTPLETIPDCDVLKFNQSDYSDNKMETIEENEPNNHKLINRNLMSLKTQRFSMSNQIFNKSPNISQNIKDIKPAIRSTPVPKNGKDSDLWTHFSETLMDKYDANNAEFVYNNYNSDIEDEQSSHLTLKDEPQKLLLSDWATI